MKDIIYISDVPGEPQVGGKFAKQAVMAKQQLRVPPFFCLTKEFYKSCTSSIHNNIRKVLDAINFSNQASIRGGSDNIRKMFENLTLSNKQEQRILKTFDRMYGKDAIVSVRASTVSEKFGQSEDSETNSFAGMSESFLYVKRHQLIEKIKLCWASGFCLESLIYRQAQHFDLMGFSVAVGVQQMIFGKKSFVMFTCDPQTAAKDVIVAGAYGIGEGVVQEAVPIDHFVIHTMDMAVESHIISKDERLSFDEEKGSGVRREPVDEAVREQPCFNDDELHQLVDLGKRVENVFGMPQDIEGTFDEKGQIWLLQSRPIVFNYDSQLIWTNSNVTESFPGVTTALTYSFSKYFYRVIFYDVYRRIGVKNEVIQDNFEKLDRMIGFLKGRVYYCLTHFYLLHKQTPVFRLMRKDWEKMMGFGASYHTKEKRSLKKLNRKIMSSMQFYIALLKNIWYGINHNRNMLRFHHWWEDTIAPIRGKDFSQTNPLELIQLFHKVWKEVGNHWGITLMNDTYLPLLNGMVTRKFKKWGLSDKHPGLMSSLLCDGGRLKSVEIILSAVALSEIVRKDERLFAAFREEKNVKQLLKKIDNEELNPEFCKKFKYHLHYNGDRGLQELKLEQPSLRDTPWELIRIIKQYAEQNASVEEVRKNERQTRKEGEKILRRELRWSPVKYWYIKVLLGLLRDLIRNRENSRYCRSELFGFSKKVFAALGHHLVAVKALHQQDDVYHLAKDDIFGYIDGTGLTENLQALADVRKAEYEENKKVNTPEQLTTIGAVRRNNLVKEYEQALLHEGELRGLPSSSGKVVGLARIILDPTQVEKIDSHEILIARETDPGWLFLMMSARGIIAEKGSTLSHTAITGRKFNIPTIVSVKDITMKIKDGTLIEMDGGTGIIKILKKKDEVTEELLREIATVEN